MNNSPTVHWRKSSHSDHQGGECVEVADLSYMIAIRDSKNPAGASLALTHDAWRSLTEHIKTSTPTPDLAG